MKPKTFAFIQWLKHEMETYLSCLDRDTVAIMLWQTRRVWHGIWRASLECEGEAMTTTSEKLIKQVSYRIASIWNERLPTWPTVGERDRIRDLVAAEIVDLVLSAFHNGGLDKEMGVVGRAEIGGAYMYPNEPKEYKTPMITTRPVTWWSRDLKKATHLENGDILIALRPLTGTGKKEE